MALVVVDSLVVGQLRPLVVEQEAATMLGFQLEATPLFGPQVRQILLGWATTVAPAMCK
jgi:hypothetical protein